MSTNPTGWCRNSACTRSDNFVLQARICYLYTSTRGILSKEGFAFGSQIAGFFCLLSLNTRLDFTKVRFTKAPNWCKSSCGLEIKDRTAGYTSASLINIRLGMGFAV